MAKAVLSRRRFLALGGAVLLSTLGRRPRAQGSEAIRIGVILERRSGRPLIEAGSQAIAAAMARRGALLAGEAYEAGADSLGGRVEVVFADAPDAQAAARAAERLVAREAVAALVGGLGPGHGEAIGAVASRGRVPFLHIGSNSIGSGTTCDTTFHLEASHDAYLDAIATWYGRTARRDWFLVHQDEPEGAQSLAAARRTLHREGLREVGAAGVPAGRADVAAAIDAVAHTRPDVILLLLPWLAQLDFLERFDAPGMRIPITALPDPTSQTREFYATARERAPHAAMGPRPTLWDPTLEAYGARDLNERFLHRFGLPMDAPAWAAYQAIAIAVESAAAVGSTEGPALIRHLKRPSTRFDVLKGEPVTFDGRAHRLVQPLYVVEIARGTQRAYELATVVAERSPGATGEEHLPSEATTPCR